MRVDEILERLSMHLSEFIEGEIVVLVIMAVFLLAKKKYSDILENDITKRCVYIFIFYSCRYFDIGSTEIKSIY